MLPLEMSAPAQNKPAAKPQRVPKIVWDLVFTLAIPVALLSPDLLGKTGLVGRLLNALNLLALYPLDLLKQFNAGESIGFSDILGNVPTYVIAALIPAIYILIDTLRTRQFNPVTTVAASSALIGGALAFLQVSGAAFALKDSYRPIVFTLVMGGSLLLGKPFFEVFLRQAITDVTDERKPLLTKLFGAPQVRTGLRNATLLIAVESAISAVANFLVNYNVVTQTFGTKTFNAQVAQANTVMYIPSLILSLAAFAAAYWLVQRGVTAAFGPKAQLFDDNIWDALKDPASEPVSGEQNVERAA
jgi:hypothetical protein